LIKTMRPLATIRAPTPTSGCSGYCRWVRRPPRPIAFCVAQAFSRPAFPNPRNSVVGRGECQPAATCDRNPNTLHLCDDDRLRMPAIAAPSRDRPSGRHKLPFRTSRQVYNARVELVGIGPGRGARRATELVGESCHLPTRRKEIEHVYPHSWNSM
jgi:hypothetical protein